MLNIMIVEDDTNTRKLMETVLTQNGYHPILATNGLEALDILDKKHIDLMILDIMMPHMDGYELAKTLRGANYHLPILMVSAKETLADKKKGFLIGIDDYMTKPVDEEEMILRIAALLRRSRIVNDHRLVVGKTELDYHSLLVIQNGQALEFPKKEFLLLFKMLSYPNQIFTRRQLMDEIWNMESDTTERTVDVHINRLRERLKDNEDFKIITVRGLGYKVVQAE